MAKHSLLRSQADGYDFRRLVWLLLAFLRIGLVVHSISIPALRSMTTTAASGFSWEIAQNRKQLLRSGPALDIDLPRGDAA
jgi:hypothetical protein